MNKIYLKKVLKFTIDWLFLFTWSIETRLFWSMETRLFWFENSTQRWHIFSCNFEDSCVLNLIGTFVVKKNLLKMASKFEKSRLRPFSRPPPHGIFWYTLKVAHISVFKDRLYRSDAKNLIEVYFKFFWKARISLYNSKNQLQ